MIPSIIRTWAAMLAAWLLGLPLTPAVLDALGVDTGRATQVVTGLVMLGIGWAWYLAVRALEHRWPRLGVLLGKVGAPKYIRPLATGGPIKPGTMALESEPGSPGLVIPTGRASGTNVTVRMGQVDPDAVATILARKLDEPGGGSADRTGSEP